MVSSNQQFPAYWQKHKRCILNGRIAWCAEKADESFWSEHWRVKVNESHYENAEKLNLSKDEQGRILLRELKTGGEFLEAGCGTGFWVAALKNKKFNVTGLEYSKDLVSLVNKTRPSLPVIYGNALSINVPDNSYDAYMSFGVVEHRFEGPEPFLEEAYRVLRPGGKILISVPHYGPLRKLKSALGFYNSHVKSLPFFQYGFSKKEFHLFLEAAGFTVFSMHAIHCHRLLTEEIPIYRGLTARRGGQYIRKFFQKIIGNRDGHMLFAVAQKPG